MGALHSHHDHQHGPRSYNRAFALGVVLNATFVVIEAAAGILAGSLALIADAGHNLSDVLMLLLAWGASAMATLPPTQRRTYGLRRTTILASLASAILLLVAVGALGWEAVRRLTQPAQVQGTVVIAVAAIGALINTATALLFATDRKRDLNIQGAFLHMAADAGVSCGVVLAGVLILLVDWPWIDPTITLLIAALVLLSTWELLRDSLNLAMDAVPKHIDPAEVQCYLSGLDGVTDLHDLHIWAMSTTQAALTVHLVAPEAPVDDIFLQRVERHLLEEFGIEHATIQVERGHLDHHGCAPCTKNVDRSRPDVST
jgi:cobalt-zinc-cadmium efflux system protein